MKNKTRFTLLFVLAIALLLGVLAAVPFVASADDTVQLTIQTVKENPDGSFTIVSDYGTVSINDAGQDNTDGTISYQGEAGTFTLTAIPKENYRFVRWQNEAGVQISDPTTEFPTDESITVYAIFAPKTYNVLYVGANPEDPFYQDFQTIYDLNDLEHYTTYAAANFVKTHTFGTETELPNSVFINLGNLQSHQFVEWFAYRLENGTPVDVSGTVLEKDALDPKQAKIKAEVNLDIYLVPKWTPNQFPVVRIDCVSTDHSIELGSYQGDDVKANYGATVSGKDFGGDQEYPGYEFISSNAENYTEISVRLKNNVIYRYYTPRAFEITFNVNAPDGKEIVNKPAPLTVFYNEKTPSITQLQCRGYCFGGYKDADGVRYFNADGTPTTEFAKWTTLNNITLYAQWEKLPIADTPEWTIDYANEALKDITPGDYQITCGGDVQTVTVSEGETISIVSFLGKTIQVVLLGVDGETADSVPQKILVSDRPDAVDFQCTPKTETKRTRELLIEVPGGTEGLYEVAYTTSNQDTPENWTTDLLLKDLEPGVTYTIYLRVRATDSAPHGVVSEPQTFDFAHLVDLKPLFIILLCLFALQILALAFLLIGRRRAQLNAVAAPLAALLAVKLIPAGFFPWIIILTIAVVALQVVLVSLAVQSSIVWKKRTDGKKKSKDAASDTAEFTLFGEKRTEKKQPAKDDQEDQND